MQNRYSIDQTLGHVQDVLRRALVVLLCVLLPTVGLPSSALAESTVEVIDVPVGDVSFGDTPGCTNCAIHQSSQDAIVHLGNLQLDAADTLRIHQPNAQARMLARISGGNPSVIDGTVHADATLILVNPAGVMFGVDSVVNAGELFAAAGSMSNADFLAGDARFTELSGGVVNHGRINADAVSLIGNYVANHGEIFVETGAIAMVAGGEAYIGKVGGHLLIRLSGNADALGRNAAVENSGILDAGASGQVSLSAGDVLGAIAVRHTGSTRAGEISLDAGSEGVVGVSGTLDASNLEAGGTGGSVDVFGRHVGVFGATIDASGDAGGGRIRVGGDFHGEGEVPMAFETVVDAETRMSADAISQGDGGQVVVWSDGATGFYGDINARGGLGAGDGGFVEVSGKDTLRFHGHVDTQASNGERGSLLLDPTNVNIRDWTVPKDGSDVDNDAYSFAGGVFGETRAPEGTIWAHQFGPVELFYSELEGLSASTDIHIEATNNITLEDLADDQLSLATTGSVTFMADADMDGSGTFSMGSSDTIRAEGADLSISAAQIVVGSLDTSGAAGDQSGKISLLASDDLTVLGTLTSGGGDVSLVADSDTNQLGDVILSGDVFTAGGDFNSSGIGFSQGARILDARSAAGNGSVNLEHEVLQVTGTVYGEDVTLTGIGSNATIRVGGALKAIDELRINNTDQLEIAANAQLMAGGELLARDTIGSVALEGTGAHTLAAGGDLHLADVTSTSGGPLQLAAGGSAELGAVEIGGDLMVLVDSDGDSSETLSIGEVQAASVHLRGGSGATNDDRIAIGQNIDADSGSIRIENFESVELAGGVDLTASELVDLRFSVGEFELTGDHGQTNRIIGQTGVHIDTEVRGSDRPDLTLATGGLGDIFVGGLQGVGRLMLGHAADASVEGELEATTVRLDNLTESARFLNRVAIEQLETGFGDYAVEFTGGGVIAGDTSFFNTGGVVLGDDAADSIEFSGGLDTSAGHTRGYGAVSTRNEQIDMDTLSLDGDLSLDSGAADLRVHGAIDGASMLGVRTSENALFSGAIGANTALSGLVADAASTRIDGGSVNTSGTQTFTGDLILGTDTSLQAGSGDVVILGDVDSASPTTPSALHVEAGGNVTSDGVLGGVAQLSSVVLEAADHLSTRGARTSGLQSYNAGGEIRTAGEFASDTGEIAFHSPVVLLDDTTVRAHTSVDFDSTIDAAAGSDAELDIALSAAGALARLNGDVGASRRPGALRIAADEIELGGEQISTVREIALNAAGRNLASTTATIWHDEGSLRLESQNVTLGKREKLSVGGDLEIRATDTAFLSDLTAAGALSVTAAKIVLQVRESGPVLLADGSIVADNGSDFIANSIDFSSVPTLSSAGQVVFATPSGGEVSSTLDGFMNTALDPTGPRTLRAADLRRSGRTLDGVATGPERTNPAKSFQGLAPLPAAGFEAPDAEDAASLTVGELMQYLRGGRGLAEDAVPGAAQSPWRGMPTAIAEFARQLYGALFRNGDSEPLRTALANAVTKHLQAGGGWPLHGAELRAFVLSARRDPRTAEILDHLSTLLEAVRRLGLTQVEFELMRAELLEPITPEGMRSEELAAAL
ncbi:MAG: filamentous hemagglutinin N-terminal domain-containing protein [bacterium]|nr:filamentous hemagglutinin N-terminal domain-containing protein [bacterium]